MSAATIKQAMANLLRSSVPGLATIYDHYPRLTPKSRTPAAILWDLGWTERRVAGGVGGAKELTYRMTTHLVVYGSDPQQASALLDDILGQVVDAYRRSIDLGRAADTAQSKVLAFAEEMSVDKPPPELAQQFVLLQAVITCSVREVVNA